ncbi:hypothetical protein NEOLEDRAFT_256710 [Neolentinus lepideus HHB14362 ss-1]|uniref:Uncharacterized protein n=1 Tax=Neolentinus lepideus HHB14362 ss-1 TaxID=1314782 RepID=A0A165TAY3_9AGAM|nr:hypothetical protein NEOLEDRAFT_256710 [Neolentinus lepideus HHB14362 ss-1]
MTTPLVVCFCNTLEACICSSGAQYSQGATTATSWPLANVPRPANLKQPTCDTVLPPYPPPNRLSLLASSVPRSGKHTFLPGSHFSPFLHLPDDE